MRKILISLSGAVVMWPAAALMAADNAPVAGAAVETLQVDIAAVARGWMISDLMSADVMNEQEETIGEVADAIVTPDDQLTYAILSVGGFLGIGDKYVAVPVELFELDGESNIVLPGATKEALESLPTFEYAK